MAGTRLWIQGIIVVEVLLATVLAFWFGLCQEDDALCRPIKQLFHEQSQTDDEFLSVFSASSSGKAGGSLDIIPPVRIFVANPDVMREWKKAVRETTTDRLDVTMNGMVLTEVCPDLLASESRSNSGPALYVCDHEQTERIVKSDTSIAVYPDGFNTAEGLLKKVLPPIPSFQDAKYKRKTLILTVIYDQTTDHQQWRSFSQLCQDWLIKFRSTSRPFIKQLRTQTRFDGTLESGAIAFNEDEHADGSTVSLLKQESIQSFLDGSASTHQQQACRSIENGDNCLYVTLYVSSTTHLRIRSKNAAQREHYDALQINGRSLFALVDPSSTTETLGERVTPLVSNLVRTTGLGMESNAPVWYNALWLQRTIKALHREADERLNEAKALLSTTPNLSSTAESKDMAELWMKARTLMDEGVNATWKGDAVGAMECTEEALTTLDSLFTLFDSSFVPEKDFPQEQAMAVFAPLLFPLLIPMLAGLRREFKRYKELQDKKNA